MKKNRIEIAIFIIIGVIALIGILTGCKSIRYVPVETLKTEYRDRLMRDTASHSEIRNIKDSIVIKDSIIYKLDEKGNVISKEIYQRKDRYRFSEHLLKQLQAKYDSLVSMKQKEIQVPYPVKGDTVYINKLKWYQEASVWFTSAVLVLLLLYLGIKHRGKIFSLLRKSIFKI